MQNPYLDILRAEAAQQIIDEETLSSNICWFCDQPAAEQEWAEEICLHRDFTTEFGLTGRRHQWKELRRKIPCCQKCFRVHKRAESLSIFGAWVGGITGFILFLVVPLIIGARLKIQSLHGFDGIVPFLILAGVIASVIFGYRGGKNLAFSFSAETKPVEHALQHPVITPFVEQGWNLGNPAANR